MYYITTNLEYKGYSRVQGCYDECYDNYIKEHGSLLEQLEEKNEQALADPYSSIRGLWGWLCCLSWTKWTRSRSFPIFNW